MNPPSTKGYGLFDKDGLGPFVAASPDAIWMLLEAMGAGDKDAVRDKMTAEGWLVVPVTVVMDTPLSEEPESAK